jgi:uncharacterized protein (TIGR02271 family)
MSEGTNIDAITPGMPVYGPDGQSLGPVEAVEGQSIRVLNHIVPPAAITRVDRNGVHLHLALAAFAAEAPQTGTAAASDSRRERLAVPIVEERLAVGTRQMQVGEVTIDKRVVEEQVMVPVTVRREEIEIIRRAPGEPREEIDDPSVVEVIRIPLRGEEPVFDIRQVVTREVVVERTVRAEEQMVTRTVRSTDITVEERVNEAYAQSRPGFEEHFTRRQQLLHQSDSATAQSRAFSEAEPHYRAGFLAGHDRRYADRTFEEIEPHLGFQTEPAGRDPGVLDQIREEVRAGFTRARTMGAR